MKKLLAALCTVVLIGCTSAQVPQAMKVASPASVTPASIVGTWKVDLRPTPDAAPYFQAFVVTSVDGKRFEGTFYGTPISQGRINTDWGTIRIAFVTEDGSGPYNHSAVLTGDRLEGLSNSTGRDFLSYWSATKNSTSN